MMRYLLGFVVLLLFGCSKKSTGPQYTIVDFDNGLIASYDFLGAFPDHYLPVNELSSDQVGVPGLASHLSTGDYVRELLRHDWSPENTIVYNLWLDLYNGVSAANNTLAIAAEVAEDIEQDRIAEARALRAFHYFLLMDVFGNIQAFKEDVLQGNIQIPQLTRAEVYAFIEAEIKETIPLLKSGSTYGKITRPVAQTILAKLYLNAEIYTGTPQWAACRDACTAIISSGNYSLVDDYFDLFAINNGSLASEEIILASTIAPAIHPTRLSVHPAQVDTKAPSTSGFQNWAVIPEWYTNFDTGNDKRANSFLIGLQKTDSGETILDAAGQAVDYSDDFRDFNPFISGYRLFRYEIDDTKINYGDNDMIIFRYADILLMQAEALNELGDQAGAVTLINEVRARAYTTPIPLNAGDFTKESLRSQILKERSTELLWEGWRRQDLIRHGQFCTSTWTQKESADDDCEKRKLFPIPQQVLDISANLVQNPGY